MKTSVTLAHEMAAFFVVLPIPFVKQASVSNARKIDHCKWGKSGNEKESERKKACDGMKIDNEYVMCRYYWVELLIKQT